MLVILIDKYCLLIKLYYSAGNEIDGSDSVIVALLWYREIDQTIECTVSNKTISSLKIFNFYGVFNFEMVIDHLSN